MLSKITPEHRAHLITKEKEMKEVGREVINRITQELCMEEVSSLDDINLTDEEKKKLVEAGIKKEDDATKTRLQKRLVFDCKEGYNQTAISNLFFYDIIRLYFFNMFDSRI